MNKQTPHSFHFTSDVTAKMSNDSVQIIPTDDLKDYAKFMLATLIQMDLRCPTHEAWDKIATINKTPGQAIDYAHRMTKVVKLVNDYCLIGELSKIEYDFIGRTQLLLALPM